MYRASNFCRARKREAIISAAVPMFLEHEYAGWLKADLPFPLFGSSR
jgi:hypothetical protein